MKQWSRASITGSYDEAVVPTILQTFQKFKFSQDIYSIQHCYVPIKPFRKTWHLNPTLHHQHVLMTQVVQMHTLLKN